MKKLLILFLLFSTSVLAQVQVTEANKAEIDRFIDYLTEHDQLAGSVAIAIDGQPQYFRTFGQENLPGGSDFPKDMVYQIGSITKMINAALIHRAVEQKKLKLDTKLSNFFPKIPRSKEITIEQMLNHTSGLKDFAGKADTNYRWLLEPVTEQEILDEIIEQGSQFDPGTDMGYSNSAYYLLARVLEKIHKKSFAQVIHDELTVPHGIKSMSGIEAGKKYANIAPSFEKEDGEWTAIKDFYFPNASGAGDVVINMQDLNLLLYKLFNYEIVSEATINKMRPGKDEDFGMGMMVFPFYQNTFHGHGGDTFGTHSLAGYCEDGAVTVSYSINAEHFSRNEFAVGVLSALYGEEYEYPVFDNIEVATSDLKKYEGRYLTEDIPLNITVFLEGDVLMGQGDGQGAFPLSPVAEHEFANVEAGLKLVFDPEAQTMVLKQRGVEFSFTKEVN